MKNCSGYLGWILITIIDYDMFDWKLSDIADPTQYITSQETMLHGSWYDAHAYCLSKNSSLFDLAPSLSGQLKRLMDSKVVQHGWKYSQELYFAGLHYDDMVGISSTILHFMNLEIADTLEYYILTAIGNYYLVH